jgi:hypothetical protein
MSKRLEVEMDGNLKEEIANYAKKKGLRLPFAYGELLKYGLHKKIEDEDKGGS